MVQTVACPTCGAPMADGARFCSSCGHQARPLGDERRVVTVVFGDLVGFTTLSESRDPEQVKNLVDRCFERLALDITAFGGKVDKVIGDAIVALFGAPTAHEDDAERAVRAALRMQQTLTDFAAGEAEGAAGAALRMRVGVNTGEVLVGALRAGGDYTAMGDVVNTAARLQTAAAPGEVLVGPDTHAATRDVVEYEPRGLLHAKGRDARVEAWAACQVLLPPGRRPRRVEAPLVGRDTELELLCGAARASLAHDRAQWVLLVGDAGVGKTRLAGELGSMARRYHGALVFEGRCVPYGEANVWWPVADAVRTACLLEVASTVELARERIGERVRQALEPPAGERGEVAEAEVDRITNGLLHLLGYEGQLRGIEPANARDDAVRSLSAFIEASTRHQPVVVLLSDLHWADQVVLDLIDTLLERLSRRQFLLVATARETLLDRWSPKPGHHNAVQAHLDPLGQADTEQLLTALLGHDLAPDLRETLLDRSGGNPFFLEELVLLVQSASNGDGSGGDGAADDAGHDHAGQDGAGAPTRLPDTLRGLVAARLDGLSVDERTVVQDAAVLGRRSSVGALRRMTEAMGQAVDVPAAVASLVAKDLFTLDGGSLSFRSDLVREVAYGALTKADRAHRHVGIAEWIEAHAPGQFTDDLVDRLANHYGVAADLVAELGHVELVPADVRARAVRWTGEAAERATRGQVLPMAVHLYTRALELAGPGPSPERLALLLGRSRVQADRWELGEARADVEAARAEADALHDEVGEALALTRLGDVEQKEGHPARAVGTLSEAVARLERLGDDAGRAEALRLRGMAEMFQGSFAAAEESVAAACTAFHDSDDCRGEAWALQNLAWIAFVTGRVDLADERLQTALATFRELDDPVGTAWATGLLGFVRFHQNRRSEAQAIVGPVLEQALAHDDRWAAAMMTVLSASLHLWNGETDAAVERASEAEEGFTALRDGFGWSQAVAPLVRAQIMSGRTAEGLGALAALRHAAEAAGNAELQDLAELVGVAAGVQLGDPDLALGAVAGSPSGAGATDGGPEPHFQSLGDETRRLSVGVARLQLGDVHAAAAELLALMDAGVSGEGQPVGEVAPESVGPLAMVLAAVGRVDDAVDLAGAPLDPERATYLDRAMAQVALGLALTRRGGPDDHDHARRALVEARALVDATQDRLGQAVIRLAEVHAQRAWLDPQAPEAERLVNGRLEALGVEAAGWSTAFAAVLGEAAGDAAPPEGPHQEKTAGG